MIKFKNFLYESEEVSDYITQTKYYLEQIRNQKGWKPITDELYDAIEEEGWVQDLTEKMDDQEYDKYREVIKLRFEYKILDLYYNWQNGHIKSKENYTVNLLTKFDEELKSKQDFPYHTLDFIDYDKGLVYIIKYLKPTELQ